MSAKKIEARLRKNHDDDLRQAIEGISSGELSELVRDGLRVMLGIRTKKYIEIKEQPVHIPEVDRSQTSRQTYVDMQKEKTDQPQKRPTVFISNNLRPRN